MANKNIPKVITTSQTIKVCGTGVVLYFNLDIEKKTVALTNPNGDSNYFRPLMDQRETERHDQFLEAYKIGIDRAKKIFRTK